jgi:hypothetical protein
MKTIRKLREDGTPAGGAPGMSSPANVTGDSPNMAMPPSMVPGPVIRRKYRQFDLETETFRKFEKGKMKFERWSRFLDLKNENHKAIYDYAYSNRGRDHTIVIRDSNTGALRAIRRRPHNGE